MRNEFKNYLIRKGYSEYTPSGNKSTVYDYIKRIDKVCEWEDFTWQDLKNNISMILNEYDIGGEKEELGKKSHSAVINALRRFDEFLNE